MGTIDNKESAPSRIARFSAFLSAGYSIRTASDRLRQERVRLRVERSTALWQRTRLYRLLGHLRGTLFMTRLSSFALLIAPMALVAICRCLLLPLLTDDFPFLPLDGAAGVILAVLALLLATYRDPLYLAVSDDRILSRLLFTMLALPRPYITMARGIRGIYLLLFGLLLAALSITVSPLLLFLILSGLVLFGLTMASPEFSLLLLGIFFPFAVFFSDPFLPIAILLGATLLSYLCKLFLGKRDFRFEPIGFFLLVFVAADLLFSFHGSLPSLAAPLKSAVVAVCAYFLTANLLVVKRTAIFFSRGMLFTATLLSALAIFSRIIALLPDSIGDGAVTLFLLDLNSRFFPSYDTLAICLVLLLPVLIGILADGKEARLRLTLSMLLLLATLVLTIAPLALVAITLSLVLFTLLNTGSRAGIYFFLCAVLPNAVLLLPIDWCNGIASLFPFLGLDTMMAERFARLHSSFAFLVDNPLGLGNGIASGASLYLAIGLQSGIIGILAFIPMLAFVARDALRTTALERSNRHRTLPHGCASAIFAALVYAPFQNIFADIRTTLLFFLTVGIFTAVCRIGWLEDDFHRRQMQDDDHESYATEIRIAH